jgi:hypothetical protein
MESLDFIALRRSLLSRARKDAAASVTEIVQCPTPQFSGRGGAMNSSDESRWQQPWAADLGCYQTLFFAT